MKTVERWAVHQGNMILIRDEFGSDGRLSGVYVGKREEDHPGRGDVVWHRVHDGFEFEPEHTFCEMK